MSEPALTAPGYTPRLAIRHLAIGLSRPRAVVREALAAGIGEWGRLALFATCLALFAVSDAGTRASLTSYIDNVLQIPEIWLKILGFLLLLSMFLTILLIAYAAGSVCSYAILLFFKRGRPIFANTRSAFSLACWIAMIPMEIFYYIDERFDSPTRLGVEQISLFSALIALIFLMYFTFCLSEATAASLAVSAATALGGLLGVHVALEGLASGLEQVVAIVRDAQSE